MKFIITFKIQNPEFDSKYAKMYHFGKESIGNSKDLFSKSFQLKNNIISYKETKGLPFEISLKSKDALNGTIQIPDVFKITCISDMQEENEIIVSNKLISKIHVAHNAKYDTTRYYFYLKHNVEYSEIGNNIYIANSDIPAELLEIEN